MIKFLIKLFQFLLLAFVIYVIALNIIEELFPSPFKPNILYQAGDDLVSRKIKQSDTIKSLDILFLGSSHAYDSFDPLIFENAGFDAFNWGTSQQSHIQTQMILESYLEKLEPKIVVYEVFPEIFNATGRESMADFLNSGKPFEVQFWDLFQYENSISLLNTFLIKKSRAILGVKDNEEILNEKISYYKGFIKKESLNLEGKVKEKIKWVPRKIQIMAFEENLKIIENANIPVILVVSPYPFEYSNEEKIDEYLRSKGVLFNYNNILEFDPVNDFSDFHHMNYSGVLKMNKHFIEEVLELKYKSILK